MKKYKIKSYCKVNLSLRVLNKRKDGYHNVKSLMTFCGLYDEIFIKRIRSSKDKVIFSGKFATGINNKSNTITQTLTLLRKKNFLKKKFFYINVKKNIPHGSGLGGGSSNAANLLDFLNRKMNLNIENREIKKIADQVGSDVSVSLKRKNTLLVGKKNQIIRINNQFKLDLLIVYPNIICSTQRIYKFSDSSNFSKTYPNFNKITKKKLIYFLINEKNELQKTVIKFYPRVNKIINIIKNQYGCYFSRITGSGSSCIGVFANSKAAICTQKLIKLKFPKYWSVVSKTI